MAKRQSEELPVRPFASGAAWERWLVKHHESSGGIWIRFAKKGSGVSTVTHAEALDVALCYGWIDGQAKPLDDRYYLRRFTPRTGRSKWSKINCGNASRLVEAGRMRRAGLRQMEAAKADGRWDAAYDSPRNATVPEDLAAALGANRRAAEFFESFDKRNRYAILYRVQDAKRPETRARRIETFVKMLARGEKVHP
jgi:uncharacterized protein YdeI (YjbR/CyaY-like superfamily)